MLYFLLGQTTYSICAVMLGKLWNSQALCHPINMLLLLLLLLLFCFYLPAQSSPAASCPLTRSGPNWAPWWPSVRRPSSCVTMVTLWWALTWGSAAPTGCGAGRRPAVWVRGYILHPTSYRLHPTGYILHPTSYRLHSTSYILQATFYILHSTVYSLQSTVYIQDSTFYILHSTLKMSLLPYVTSTMECLLPIHSCSILLNKFYSKQLIIVPSKYRKKFSSEQYCCRHKYYNNSEQLII